MNVRIDDLKGEMNTRFDAVDKEIVQVNVRIDDLKGEMNTRFDAVGKEIVQVNVRIDDLKGEMNTRFDAVGKEFSVARKERKELGDQVNDLTQSVTRLETYTTTSVRDKLDALEGEMKTFTAAQRMTSREVGRLEGYLEMHRRKRRLPDLQGREVEGEEEVVMMS